MSNSSPLDAKPSTESPELAPSLDQLFKRKLGLLGLELLLWALFWFNLLPTELWYLILPLYALLLGFIHWGLEGLGDKTSRNIGGVLHFAATSLLCLGYMFKIQSYPFATELLYLGLLSYGAGLVARPILFLWAEHQGMRVYLLIFNLLRLFLLWYYTQLTLSSSLIPWPRWSLALLSLGFFVFMILLLIRDWAKHRFLLFFLPFLVLGWAYYERVYRVLEELGNPAEKILKSILGTGGG